MITETRRATFMAVSFSDSALFVVFTTLYVDVKEPDRDFFPALWFNPPEFLPSS